MVVCGLSLHQGSTESRKTLEQKFIFQIGTKSLRQKRTPETDEIKSLLPTFIIQIHWLKIFTYTLQHLKPLSPVRKYFS